MNEKLKEFSDEDLLLELRYRNRLKRVVRDQIVPAHLAERPDGPPDDYMISRLGREIGYEIGQRLAAGEFKVPGHRIERGQFLGGYYPYKEQDKKFILPLNFVVEP